MPTALILVGKYDPLRDEGKHYVEKLTAAGVLAEYRLYSGVVYAFMSHSGIVGVGIEALNDEVDFLLHDI